MKLSFTVKDIIGISISGILLFYIFKMVRFELFWQNFREMNVLALLLCMLIHGSQTVLLGKRWNILFNNDLPKKPFDSTPSYWIGNFYNSLLPGRMGDAVKVFHFSKKYALSYKNVIAALITEKLIDVQIVSLFGILYFCFFSLDIGSINWIILGLSSGIIIVDIILLFFVYNSKFLKRIFRCFPHLKFKLWIYQLFFKLQHKFWILFTTKKILLFGTGSLMVYFIGIICLYLNLRAVHLEGVFSDISTYIAFPTFFLMIHFIPAAPSSAGVVHYGIYKALMAIAIAKGLSISTDLENKILFSTIVFHLSYFVPETIIGFFYMIRERQVLFDFNKVED